MTTIELSKSGLQILIFLLLSRQTSFLVFFPPLPSEKEKKIKTTQTSDQHKPCSFPNTKYLIFVSVWFDLKIPTATFSAARRGVSRLTNERCRQTKGLSCISVH